MNEKPVIHNRGRGPEIKGTRITVYDVMDYYSVGWASATITAILGISPEQLRVAIEYIEDNREYVDREYAKILDRCERGNPPEVQRKLDQASAKLRAFVEARRDQAAGRREH